MFKQNKGDFIMENTQSIEMLQNLFTEFTINYSFLLPTLGIFILIDFITGILKAYKKNEVLSSKLRDGGFKKCGIVLVCFIGFALSHLFYDEKHIISNSVHCYYIYTELISIIENLDTLGISLPPFIKKILKNQI